MDVQEQTIRSVQRAYAIGEASCRDLTQQYLERIEQYDAAGPHINSVIATNPDAMRQAEQRDRVLEEKAPVGPLHGVHIMVKDQIDVRGMPTTLGSVLFREFHPRGDATVIRKLRDAGAIILGKTTLGEMGAGDAHGSLFGSTRNPYDSLRTAGGSSGGSAAAVTANFTCAAIGQEGLSSIMRPSAWNSVVGMRPTSGLVSRAGAFSGWPNRTSSIGPIARTVEDVARLLDVLAGYDPLDPQTAYGKRRLQRSFVSALDPDALEGARIGVLRQSVGIGSDPDSADFKDVTDVFDRAVDELRRCGAHVVDPVIIPSLQELLSRRAFENGAESFSTWMHAHTDTPFMSYEELIRQPEYMELRAKRSNGHLGLFGSNDYGSFLRAREELFGNFMRVLAEHELDALVHKSVEHTATAVADGIKPPYVDGKGAMQLNTFLNYVPSISVPVGYSRSDLPVGVSFVARPFDDRLAIAYAYAYENATWHRRQPVLVTDGPHRSLPPASC
jgi:Asp-tRNAAsn/Glu-tRNAGln amidotransferase A subunit and related amidases